MRHCPAPEKTHSLRLLSTHSKLTTVLPLRDERMLRIRIPSQPDHEQSLLYQKLRIKWKAAFKSASNKGMHELTEKSAATANVFLSLESQTASLLASNPKVQISPVWVGNVVAPIEQTLTFSSMRELSAIEIESRENLESARA